MKIKVLLIALLIFNFPTATTAQKINVRLISGNLVNENKLPVQYATIVLQYRTDSSVYKTVFTDSAGHFILEPLNAGNYFLKITAAGYEDFLSGDINLLQTDTLVKLGTLQLAKSGNILSAVTVRSSSPLVERTIDKTVVNVANSIASDGATVLEALKKLPGVQVSSDGQVTMNGRQGANIYIDGKPSYLSGEDLVNLLSSMAASNIQKIELISNPSSKYDADGSAGIINIVKKKNRKEGLNGSFNAGAGKGYYGRYNSGLTVSYKNRWYNLFFNNTYSYNKSFNSRLVTSDILGTSGKMITEQASTNTGTNIGRNYRPTAGMDFYLSGKTTLSLSGTSGISSSANRLTSVMDIADSNRKKINQAFFTSALRDKPFNYNIGATISFLPDTTGKLFTADLDYSSYNNRPQQSNANKVNDAGGNFINETNAKMFQYRKLDLYAAKADFTLPLPKKQRLEMGIKSSYVKADNSNDYFDVNVTQNVFDSANSNYSVNSENINAAYLNYYSPYKKWAVQAGLRAEQTIAKGKQLITGESVHQKYVQLFPSLFLEYKPGGKHVFTTRLGRRIERAAYNELVPFRRPQTATLFFQGNPNLLPTTSWHGELGWTYKNAFSITLNYDIQRNYIRTMPFSDSNKTTITRTPVNIRQAHSWDIDLTWSKKITRWWRNENSLSVYENTFNGTVNDFNFNNQGLISAYLLINNSFQFNDQLSGEINFEYNSQRVFVTSSFGPYSILNLGIKRQVLKNKGSVSLNINNLLQSEDHNAIDRNNGLYQYSYFYFHSRYAAVNLVYRFGKTKISKTHISSGAEDEQKRAGN